MERRVGDAQQSIALRREGQRHVPRRVARRRDGSNTGHYLRFVTKEFKLSLDRLEVVAREREEESHVLISLQSRLFRGPEIPLVFPHDETGVGESGRSAVDGVSTDVVRMAVR